MVFATTPRQTTYYETAPVHLPGLAKPTPVAAADNNLEYNLTLMCQIKCKVTVPNLKGSKNVKLKKTKLCQVVS